MSGEFKSTVKIGPHELGRDRPAMVVAEIGGNHGGDISLAKEMIEAAAQAGAVAVKFQAYQTGEFLTRSSSYFDELAAEELSFEALAELSAYAESKGIIFFFTVFDRAGVELAGRLDIPAIKISSGDLTNLPLLEAAAGLKKTLILSTGASDLEEVEGSLNFLAESGADQVVLLQCTAMYPCPDDEVNLLAMETLANRFRLPVGFSDHTLGVEIPLAALGLGAVLIEKHFTVDRGLPGGDNEMSALPEELALIVRAASRVALARGRAAKQPTAGENGMRQAIRRSVVAGRAIASGEVMGPENLAVKRPGNGLAPKEIFALIGRRAVRDLTADEPLSWDKVI